jgi:DNA polymerase-3 subunit chi
MPKIDFYILADSTESAHRQLICRLVEKAYQQKHQVYIQTQNQREAEQLNQLLWTYRDDSFIPHNLYGETLKPLPPIQIGFNQNPEDHRDILLNLSDDVPSFYPQFSRILEVVSGDPVQQSKARDRFRFYRENNCEMTTHKI